MDMDPSALQEVAEQLKSNPELARIIMEEQQKMEAQNQLKVIVNRLTADCWDMCVDRVGNSLGRQETCLNNCALRFLDTDKFIRQRMKINIRLVLGMDPELDDLLNDALADFDKPSTTPETSKAKDESKSEQHVQPDQKSNSEASSQIPPPSDVFRQFFDENMTKRLEQEWQSAIEELKCDDPALATHLEKLSTTLDTATAAMSSEETQPSCSSQKMESDAADPTEQINLEKVMRDTISGLGKSADDIKNMSKDEAEEKLFAEMSNLGLGDGMGDMMGGLEGDFMQMMEGMMQNLLSKDVLYPTMKEISKAYPDWFNENETRLSPNELTRFKKQQTLINKICESFEAEHHDDTQEIKRKRLNEMMLLVEQMQECGNPPQDLIEKCAGESSVDVEKFFGVGGGLGPNPFKPGAMNPDGCSVM